MLISKCILKGERCTFIDLAPLTCPLREQGGRAEPQMNFWPWWVRQQVSFSSPSIWPHHWSNPWPRSIIIPESEHTLTQTHTHLTNNTSYIESYWYITLYNIVYPQSLLYYSVITIIIDYRLEVTVKMWHFLTIQLIFLQLWQLQLCPLHYLPSGPIGPDWLMSSVINTQWKSWVMFTTATLDML